MPSSYTEGGRENFVEAGRQHHGTRQRPSGDLSTAQGFFPSIRKVRSTIDSCPRGAGHSLAEQEVSPSNSFSARRQVLRKGRAWSRKGASTLRHHAAGGPDSRTSQLRACGTQAHSMSQTSRCLVNEAHCFVTPEDVVIAPPPPGAFSRLIDPFNSILFCTGPVQ